MSEIQKMDWESKFSVYIEEIDAFQKKMFELFNQLIELKENKKDAKECINLISEINEFSKLYFATEERILRRKGYPDIASHAKAHRQFAKRSISLRREVSEDIANLTDEVINGQRDWLINHILELDSLYIPFVRITDYIQESKLKK